MSGMIDDVEYDARRGLEVERYHTWPVIRRQSVGLHSAQVMRIVLAVHPDASRALLVWCLTHDMGEMAGDLPWPVKKNDPELKKRMSEAEGEIYEQMVARWRAPWMTAKSISEQELLVFKMCESIEMWEYALTEVNMGNRYAAVVASRMIMAADGFRRQIGDLHIVGRTDDYIQRRLEQEQ